MCVLVCGSHSEGCFGGDAVNKRAGHICIVCLPSVHCDSSRLRMDTVSELPYHRWGGGLESKKCCGLSINVFVKKKKKKSWLLLQLVS